MAGTTTIPFELTMDRVIDACGGHDRQAIRALKFSPEHTLTGVLAHDPIVWTERERGRTEALCELEADASFDPTLVLFTADHTRVLAGHPGSLRMYNVSDGTLCWQLSLPWWEVIERDPESFACLQYSKGSPSSSALIDVRTGALTDRVEIPDERTPPTATIEKGQLVLWPAYAVLPIELARPWTTTENLVPKFSMDPNAHARLWPRKLCKEQMFLCVSYSSVILQAVSSIKGGRQWRPPQPSTALALLDNGRVIVAVRDTIPATLVLIDALTGRDGLAMKLPTEQAEAVVTASVDAAETQLALGTTLGRAIVISLQFLGRSSR